MYSINLKDTLSTKPSAELSGIRKGSFWNIAPFEGGVSWIGKLSVVSGSEGFEGSRTPSTFRVLRGR